MTASNTIPPPLTAWIADDGELDPVRRLLWERGVVLAEEFEEAPPHVDLLVSNPRHTLQPDLRSSIAGARVHLVVAERPTRRLVQQLQRARTDFIVDADVHPEALRLLVEYALYTGPERRAGHRAPMSLPVRLKVGWRTRNATLLQLSERGCGISLASPVSRDNKLALRLPSAWTDGAKIDVPLVLLRSDETADGDDLASFRFEGLDPSVVKLLRKQIARVGNEVGLLKPSATTPTKPSISSKAESEAKTEKPTPETASKGDDRRRSMRAAYRRQLLATGDGCSHVILGRDISSGGMRIGPDADLAVGQELKLALYGSGRRERIIVRARVVRDAGADGLGLEFEGLKPEMQERLVKLVDSTLVLRGARRGRSKSPNVIVSEILDDESAD